MIDARTAMEGMALEEKIDYMMESVVMNWDRSVDETEKIIRIRKTIAVVNDLEHID